MKLFSAVLRWSIIICLGARQAWSKEYSMEDLKRAERGDFIKEFEEQFDHIDKNDDGKLSLAELMPPKNLIGKRGTPDREAIVAAHMAGDKDRDGYVQPGEELKLFTKKLSEWYKMHPPGQAPRIRAKDAKAAMAATASADAATEAAAPPTEGADAAAPASTAAGGAAAASAAPRKASGPSYNVEVERWDQEVERDAELDKRMEQLKKDLEGNPAFIGNKKTYPTEAGDPPWYEYFPPDERKDKYDKDELDMIKAELRKGGKGRKGAKTPATESETRESTATAGDTPRAAKLTTAAGVSASDAPSSSAPAKVAKPEPAKTETPPKAAPPKKETPPKVEPLKVSEDKTPTAKKEKKTPKAETGAAKELAAKKSRKAGKGRKPRTGDPPWAKYAEQFGMDANPMSDEEAGLPLPSRSYKPKRVTKPYKESDSGTKSAKKSRKSDAKKKATSAKKAGDKMKATSTSKADGKKPDAKAASDKKSEL